MILNAKQRKPYDTTRTGALRLQFERDTAARVRVLKRELVSNTNVIKRSISGSQAHWERYAKEAYRKGVEQAYTLSKRNIPKDEFGVLKKDFMKTMKKSIEAGGKEMAKRIHLEMENVGQDTATRVARIVSDSRRQGLSTARRAALVREEYDKAGRRLNKIVHTETTRAFADGQLDAFIEVGMEFVEMEMEWMTSGLGMTAKGNPSPCPICKPKEGKVFTLEQAKGLIPLHPFCLCSWKPVFNL